MALLLNSAVPAGTDAPSTLDDVIGAFKTAVQDIFGIPNNTTISAAVMSVDSGGLQYIAFTDEAADAAAAGRLQRNAANLTFHDGTAARTLVNTATAQTLTSKTLTSPTLTTPTIASFANATHTHANAAGGGAVTIAASAITSGQLATARGGTGVDASAIANGNLLIGNGSGFSAAALTAGTGIEVTNGSGSITLTGYGLDELTGLALSNNGADATNDLDIAVGAATSDDAAMADRRLMSLTSALTKRLDATWAVGTNQGMRATADDLTGAKTFHIYLMKRADTGVVDVLAATSLSPVGPANYGLKRRLGSILWSGSAIVSFSQDGDEFLRDAAAEDYNSNVATTATSVTLSVPTGIQVRAILDALLSVASGTNDCHFSSLDQDDETPAGSALYTGSAGQPSSGHIHGIRTNTSAQVRIRSTIATSNLRISTRGWLDRRGRG